MYVRSGAGLKQSSLQAGRAVDMSSVRCRADWRRAAYFVLLRPRLNPEGSLFVLLRPRFDPCAVQMSPGAVLRKWAAIIKLGRVGET